MSDSLGRHRRWLPQRSMPGLLAATLFLAASLTPSLVPRGTLVQGGLSGISLAAGYGLGRLGGLLWQALQLPAVPASWCRWLRPGGRVLCALIMGLFLSLATGWQNRLRALMAMPPVDSLRPLGVLLLAGAVFLVLLWLARGLRLLTRLFSARIGRLLPGPQALVLAVGLTALLVWNLANNVIAHGVMTVLDNSYARYDALFDAASARPTDPHQTGGPGSLLRWEDLGRAGREMIAAGPDRAAIAAATGGPARAPLRVYVGLNSAPDPQARAELALAELLRIDAFARSTLVITTPTGTGWVDPESQRALEYLLRGDVATVAVQYSYLASWIALLADPDYGVATARAVFAAVYGHWKSLPVDQRPRLYLHGLSLGALNSDLSHDLYQVISDPYDGALWAGPPFASPTWADVTRTRNPGSPAWLPAYRDGSAIRFTGQDNALDQAAAPWGRFRIIFLQYASDAVVFFDPKALWRRPEWMTGPRGPDVSADFIWLPVVSFLQLAVDVMTAVVPPPGHGHTYRFEHYLDAWAALTDAPGWAPADLARLRAQLARPIDGQ